MSSVGGIHFISLAGISAGISLGHRYNFPFIASISVGISNSISINPKGKFYCGYISLFGAEISDNLYYFFRDFPGGVEISKGCLIMWSR